MRGPKGTRRLLENLVSRMTSNCRPRSTSLPHKRETSPTRKPRPDPHWRARQITLCDKPIEQPPHHAEQMVIASWPHSGSGGEEGLQQFGLDLIHRSDPSLDKKTIEQAQCSFFGVKAASQHALVCQVAFDGASDRAMESLPSWLHTISSPSPSATLRKASTATLL